MTIEGVAGYGYSSQGNPGQDNQTHGATSAQGLNGGNAQAGGQAEDHAEEVATDLGHDAVPGFEGSASDCFNRARQIARSLNHTDLSSDHLMLALIMDQSARRLLERVGDITQLREVATQRVGRNYTNASGEHGSPKPTSDLADIAKKARDAAAEREQLVSISDLVNAFPKSGDRLTYASGEGTRTRALVEAIETGLVPRVSESMDKIHAVCVEAIQQGQTVQKMLQDLNAKQSFEAEQRQVAFMEDIRRQVREAVDMQVGTALKQFGEELMRKLDEVPAEDANKAAEPAGPEPMPEPPTTPRTRPNPWGWLGLV